MNLEILLSAQPGVRPVAAAEVAARVSQSGRVLIVLDDDPTGTQAVAGLPVLANWRAADLEWALDTGAPAVYVLTNTRSFDEATAARINREVVTAALAAAETRGKRLGFVSRGDSTLRGHFPLEPDTIAAALEAAGHTRPHGVVVVPAFPEAKRVSIDGIHYTVEDGQWVPVGESEFARDATFGFRSSRLADWVSEKSGGSLAASDVVELRLTTIRAGAEAIAAQLRAAALGSTIVADAVVEDDMRQLALGLELVEAEGRSYIYRVGPPFVRARIGQEPSTPIKGPLDDATTGSLAPAGGSHAPTGGGLDAAGGGLIVVGSHTAVTTRQLGALRTAHPTAVAIELNVAELIAPADPHEAIRRATEQCVAALATGNVILQTSRTLVSTSDPEESLAIARGVSEALVAVTRGILAKQRPSFVIAKGGITSSDIATKGLGIERAWVAGSLFPGLVSVWRAVDGPAQGIPYVVFPGNVGTDDSLAAAVTKLTGNLADNPEHTRAGAPAGREHA
ncbi:hypothetical protein ACI1US_01320 [Leucobacter sp. BZR 635]